MLNKLKKSNKQKPANGFTIIEVMIVLAIAGLIILIVFLAVPALQRNSRNTAIKNDASAISGAIATFNSDNDGARVTAISANGLVSGATAPTTTQARLQSGTTVNTTPLAAQPTTVIPAGTISYRLGASCNGNLSGRAVSIWYSVETSSAATAAANNKCVDS